MKRTLSALKAVKADFEANKETIWAGGRGRYIQSDIGLCNAVYMAGGTVRLLYPHFETWPKYSGSRGFPVGNGVKDYYHHKNLWIRDRGKLRLELLDYLIAELERELK